MPKEKKKVERQETNKNNPRCANPNGCIRIAYWSVSANKQKDFHSCTLHIGYLIRAMYKKSGVSVVRVKPLKVEKS